MTRALELVFIAMVLVILLILVRTQESMIDRVRELEHQQRIDEIRLDATQGRIDDIIHRLWFTPPVSPKQ